jgi:hypothetical protein
VTPSVYQVLTVYAGKWLVERERQPLVLGRDPLPPGGHAVYVAEGRDGTVLYVGSTARMRDPYGTRARLGVHLTERAKRFSWDSVIVLRLRADTPPDEVRQIEGLVGLDLRPVQNKRLPRMRPRPPRGGRGRPETN